MIQDETSLKQYLLGTLDEQEQAALEQRLFLDGDRFEQLLIAEDELTDAYTRNALSPSERERYERHFLAAPEHQQKLRFTQAFHRQLDRMAEQVVPPKRGWFSWLSDFLRASHPVPGYALSAACAFIALGGLWLAFEFVRLQNEVSQLRAPAAEQELRQRLAESQARNTRLERALQDSHAQVAQLKKSLAQAQQSTPRNASTAISSVAAFVLTPGALTRDSGSAAAINRVPIPTGKHTAQLQLDLEQDQYPAYRAVLYTQGGTALKRWDEVRPQTTQDGKSLQVSVPAALLPAGAYYFRLEGLTIEGRAEKADQFHFQVTRK